MSKRLLLPIVCAVLAASASPAAGQRREGQRGPLADLEFMTGCWRGTLQWPGSTLEETWTSAEADMMLATSRYIHGSKVTGFEFSRIQADSAGISLTPYPDGTSTVSFALVGRESGAATFQNLRHDFPKRIIYRRVDDDTNMIRIEDDTQGTQWEMKRCGA
jgi:hypothetical protein